MRQLVCISVIIVITSFFCKSSHAQEITGQNRWIYQNYQKFYKTYPKFNFSYKRYESAKFRGDGLEFLYTKNNLSDSQTDNSVKRKIFFRSIAGAFAFGLFGAIISIDQKSIESGCDAVSDCKRNKSKTGLSVGAFVGSTIGFIAQRKLIKAKKPFLKIFAGNLVGAAIGYYMIDFTFGTSAFIFPAISTGIALQL